MFFYLEIKLVSLLMAQIWMFQFTDVILATILRWMRLLWRRILVFMKLKPANYAASSDAWTELTSEGLCFSESGCLLRFRRAKISVDVVNDNTKTEFVMLLID